jgi:hypothetical protein
MNAKNITIAGFSGGVVLLALLYAINVIVNMIIPYDIMKFGGMRAMNDPIMILFFFYPFVVAFALAIVFDMVKGALTGTQVQKGLQYSALLVVIMTIPSLFVMYSSMTWPVDFYISTLLWEITGFLIISAINVKIWQV